MSEVEKVETEVFVAEDGTQMTMSTSAAATADQLQEFVDRLRAGKEIALVVLAAVPDESGEKAEVSIITTPFGRLHAVMGQSAHRCMHVMSLRCAAEVMGAVRKLEPSPDGVSN